MLVGFGFPMGPFAVSDLAGLRHRLCAGASGWKRSAIRAVRYASHAGGQAVRARPLRPEERRRLVSLCPRKAGGRSRSDRLDRGEARGTGHRAHGPSTAGAWNGGCRATIVNEGARILAEGIVPRALDIDMVLFTAMDIRRGGAARCSRPTRSGRAKSSRTCGGGACGVRLRTGGPRRCCGDRRSGATKVGRLSCPRCGDLERPCVLYGA